MRATLAAVSVGEWIIILAPFASIVEVIYPIPDASLTYKINCKKIN